MSVGEHLRYIEFLWDLSGQLPRVKRPDNILVRRANIQDRKDIGKMIVEAYLPEWSWWVRQIGGRQTARIDLMSYVKDFTGHPKRRIFISEVGNRIVGLCGAAKYNKGTGTIGYGVAVLPMYRGRGIGSVLLFSAMDWLKRSGIRWVSLEEGTFSFKNKNIPAIFLYRKFGGKVIKDKSGS